MVLVPSFCFAGALLDHIKVLESEPGPTLCNAIGYLQYAAINSDRNVVSWDILS